MAGTMRKMMEYLSLAEPADDEYYDDVADGRQESSHDDRRESRETREHRAEVTPISRAAAGYADEPEPSAPAAQSVEDLRRIVTVHPSGYNEARVIGEAFREGTPVIMNLGGMSEPDAKRMVDFSAGLVFGLHGSMERVTNRVFLLSPATVEVGGGAANGDVPGRFFSPS